MSRGAAGFVLLLSAVCLVFAGERAATGAQPVEPAGAERFATAANPHSDFEGVPERVGESPYTDAGNVTWTYGTQCPKLISRLSGAVVAGKLHIVTGEVSGTPNRAPDQIFTFATNTWSEGLAHPGGVYRTPTAPRCRTR